MVKCEQWLEALVTLSVAQDCWILEEINVTIRTCTDEPERSQGENRVGENSFCFFPDGGSQGDSLYRGHVSISAVHSRRGVL